MLHAGASLDLVARTALSPALESARLDSLAMAMATVKWTLRSAQQAASAGRHTWERLALIVALWIHTQTLHVVVTPVVPVSRTQTPFLQALAVNARSHMLARLAM